MNILDNLKEQGVSESLIKDIEYFRKEYDVEDELKERVTKSPAFSEKRIVSLDGKDTINFELSSKRIFKHVPSNSLE